ncbi:DUF2218 domain-containing protein [Acinetobacter sp. WZC-1]|uniref:DUF2218 domain-containing protein n=1 Tax=Acinetobacter sp. WZC-1 TaxID=3459034 RepID=UPI00403DC165
MKSNTAILTHESQRIAKRLLNHWKHKFEVEETGTSLSIFMPDATVIMQPLADQLAVQIDTQREDYLHLEQVVINHLNRMAQQQFDVEWQHQN